MVKKYGTAILIWMLLIPIAILNGGLREYVLVYLGVIARPLSGIILSSCILSSDWNPWFLLTNIFDLILFIKNGGGLIDLLQSYDISTGNTWILVVLTALLSPLIVMKIRNHSHAAR